MSGRASLPDGHDFAGLRPPYGVLYADPPWAFRTWTSGGHQHRGAERHYRTTETGRQGDLPVADLAARDCALFMWTTSSHLAEAVELIAAWGFTFKSLALVWVKIDRQGRPLMGHGYGTRQECEVCLLGTRGKPKRQDAGVRQVIMAPRGRHSAKPAEARRRVERLFAGPYCELFAREHPPHWDGWGDQATPVAPESLPPSLPGDVQPTLGDWV